MIHTMKQEIVITNLRIPKHQWIEIKVRAAELDLSANEYIKRVITFAPYQKKVHVSIKRSKKKSSIWDLPKLAKKYKNIKGLELSEDDKIIYGI